MSNGARQRIMVVDDHESVLESFRLNLQSENYSVDYFSSGRKAYQHFAMAPSDYVMAFIDYNLLPADEEFADGAFLIGRMKKLNEDLVVAMVSGDTSEEAYQKWVAADVDKVLYKPVSKQKILAHIKAVVAKHEEVGPRKTFISGTDYAKEIGMVGESDDFQNTARNVLKFAEVDSDVLILGETGTGKELIAKAIHHRSKRGKSGKFVAVNCAAFKGDANLLESELFGHEKGAFTGAHVLKIGVFEAAHGGTIFLDEIHQLGRDAQAKLLRALQERKIKRVGANKEFAVDFRLICAGKPKLKEMCKGESPEFLPDLYYRISNIDLMLTPLREHPEDILPLLNHFKKKVEEKLNVKKDFSISAIQALKIYNWPGNVRELENMVERLLVTVEDRIIKRIHLSEDVVQAKSIHDAIAASDLEALEILQAMQLKRVILSALVKNEHNVKQTADTLKVKRTTLSSKMKVLGILDSCPLEREGMLQGIIDNLKSFRI